jgi:hypothetical protein
MKRLPLLLLLAMTTAAIPVQAQTRAPAPSAAPPAGTEEPAPTSPLDGDWRGRSDGGSCNAPLDYVITIENGFVDGSSYDTTAHGPVPNLRKAAPPPPGPGLWQIHGVARPSGPFNLISVASVKGSDRRQGKLTAQSDGAGLVITETGGCRRTARLSRS